MDAVISLISTGDITDVGNCSCPHPQFKIRGMRKMILIASDLAKNACPENHLRTSNYILADPAPVREPIMSLPDDPALRSCTRSRKVAVCEVDWEAIGQADRGIGLHK
jgi:hypothetical protein